MWGRWRCSEVPRWGCSKLIARKPAGDSGERVLGGQGRGLHRVLLSLPQVGCLLAAGGKYLLHDVAVAMAGSQVQRGIITAVHHVDACSPHDEHVDHIGAALTAGPVQGAKAMVIPAEMARTALLIGCSLPAVSSLSMSRERRTEHGQDAADSTAARQVSPCAPANRPRQQSGRVEQLSRSLPSPQGPRRPWPDPISRAESQRRWQELDPPPPSPLGSCSAWPSKGGGDQPGLKRRLGPGRRGPLHPQSPSSPPARQTPSALRLPRTAPMDRQAS